MPGFSVLLSILLTAPTAKHHALPADAVISFESSTNIAAEDKNPSSTDAAVNCSQFHLSERQLRRMFRTFLEVGEGFGEMYDRLPCDANGTVSVHGETFKWTVNQGNWMSTTYPDGEWKTLGGNPKVELGR